MIDVSYLIANLDAVLGDNMFLKDAHKAYALKDYLKNQIDLNQQLLRNLGEWY